MTPKYQVGDKVIADGDIAFITQIIDPPGSHPQDGVSYAVEWDSDEWGTFSEDEITIASDMNNKLKKLAQQAGFGLRDGELYTAKLEHLPITENMEKFAELIVKECQMQNMITACSLELDANPFVDQITKHFGV